MELSWHLCFLFGIAWSILILFPSIKADFKLQRLRADLATHPSSLLGSSPSQANFSLESSPSFLHKIIHQNDFHLPAQPSKTGASNLHRIIQRRLGQFPRNHVKISSNYQTKDLKENSTTTSHVPSSINNARLKRQLEGIFHVRGTIPPVSLPIIPSQSITKLPEVSHNEQTDVNGNTNNNRTQTTEKEIRKEEAIQKTNKYPSSTTNSNVDFTDTDVPRAIKDKRNFTVEIVEISRKTLFKQDSSDDNDDANKNKLPLTDKKTIDSKASLHKANFLKPSSIFNPTRPRLTFRRFRHPPNQLKIFDDSQNSQTQTSKTEATSSNPQKNKPTVTYREIKNPDNSVEVKVTYQEQIPYNERDIDEADLKDYLDGHSTFGSKGDFKHTVSRNVTALLPSHVKSKTFKTNNHEVYKRAPQVPQPGSATNSPKSRRVRGGRVSIEQANVKQMNNHPRTTVYSAADPNQVSDSEDDSKSVFQYQGNREKPTKPEAPQKNPESLHELFRQGHPGILKAPQPIYKNHPLGEPYGRQQNDHPEYDENPFRANPLIDEPPLKFDPESDRFYGEPTPEKDKRLAQSNRPEPVRIENAENNNQTPEYQEEERPSTTRRTNDNDNDDRYYYQRDYEPNDFDYEKATDIGNTDTDPYIRDFVSLDSNFERLPRPSAADESFRSLVPAEADDEETDRYFEPDSKTNDYNDDDRGRDRDSDEESTRRSQGGRGNDRQYNRNPSRSRSNDDYSEDEDRESKERFDENENPSEKELEKESRNDFDPSYVDALSHFDEEIKRIQELDRRNAANGNPTTTTREPPLVITSPGPVVPYPTRGNAQRPTHSTTPMDEESREQEDDQTNRPDDQNQGTEKSEEQPDDNEEEEEEEEEEAEAPQENQSSATTAKNQEDDGENDKDAEGTRQKQMKVKIKRTSQNVTTSNKPDDKPGDLDDDISSIEKEFIQTGKI